MKIDESKKMIKELFEELKEKTFSKLGHITIFILGIVLFLLGIYGNDEIEKFKTLFLSLGEGIIVGTIVSLYIDIPNNLEFFKARLLEVMVDNNYLKTLKKDQIIKLRNDCMKHIYTNLEFQDDDFIELINETSDFIGKPFYSRYITSICVTEKEYFKEKIINYNFEIINPTKEKAEFDSNINNVLFKAVYKEKEEIQELRKVEKYIVLVDDEEPRILTEDIQMNIEKTYQNNYSYKYGVKNMEKIQFSKKIVVDISEKRIVNKDDNNYIHRLHRYPAATFSVNYHYSNNDIDLMGTGFGSLIKTRDCKVTNQGNNLRIDFFKWILPGNGVVITEVPKINCVNEKNKKSSDSV